MNRSGHGGSAALSSIYGLSSLAALYTAPKPKAISAFDDPSQPAEDFAEKILDLELELQRNCSLPLINSLMEAYSVRSMQKAIEYYECRQDPKYLQLQERMHAFLIRKDVMAVLRGTSKPRAEPAPIASDPESTLRARKDEFEQHHKSLSSQLQAQLHSPQPDLPKSRRAEKLVETAHTEAKSTVTNVHHDLRTQDEQLRRRLERRKERSASRTRTVVTEGHDGECDEEDQRVKATYEDDLEKLMEDFVAKRRQARDDLEGKYASQLEELESYTKGGANSLIQKVIDELKRTKAEELASIEAKLTQERSKAIADLKAKHLRTLVF